LDDIIIFSADFPSQATKLRATLGRILSAGLKLKPRKCSFFQSEVTFLGHVISAEGILPNPENVRRLRGWPTPRCVKEVRSFLGLGNYYRRFVQNYSAVVKPLTELTKKDKSFHWDDACQKAFDTLKDVLMGPEIMDFPSHTGDYILDTDACDVSIGAVLSQIQIGCERVIAYGSRTLNKAEQNYCVTDRELLAVKHFIEYYKHYLLGRKFLVRSDHQALKWLFSLKDPKSRIARWIEMLSAYDFSVEFRPGAKHGNADAMSRCPDPQQCQCDAEPLSCGPCSKCLSRSEQMQSSLLGSGDAVRKVGAEKTSLAEGGSDSDVMGLLFSYLMCFLSALHLMNGEDEKTPERAVRSSDVSSWALPYSAKDLRKKQLADPDIGSVIHWLEAGKRPSSDEVRTLSPATRHYWLIWKNLVLRDGVLYKEFQKQDETAEGLQLVVPRALHQEILKQVHDSLLGGHLGQKKTREKLKRRFYWFEQREDSNAYVLKCDVCSSPTRPAKPPRAPMGTMTTGAVLDRLSTDILGPLPETVRGNKYILVVSDYFSKWVEIFPISDQTAITTARVILNEVISRYGCPYDIHSDQGRNYESQLFADLCKMLEIRKTRTTPGNPRCNSQTERFNRTMLKMIKAYLKDEDDDWDLHLGCLAAAYRATPHESTGLSPNLLMLGREVRLPVEVMLGSAAPNDEEDVTSYGEYVSKLRDRMQHAHAVARKHLKGAAVRQKDAYDAKKSLHVYQPGDLVWYASQLNQLHIAPKLRRPFEGPFVVTKRLNDLVYRLQFRKGGASRNVHHNKLKPYSGRVVLKWAKAAVQKANRR
jgi:hypothetical protein